MAVEPSSEFNPAEAAVLGRYFTNLDRPVFALRNLPEVVKGALFSRYSRTEKSLRKVLLDEFINQPDSGFDALATTNADADDMVAVRRAEEFYERVLVGYGDDSVAELAGMIIEMTGSRSKITRRPLPIDDPVQRCPDIAEAERILGWRPKTALEEGLARTIDYFDKLLGSNLGRAHEVLP